MKKNVASQVIGVQMVSATDGSAFTGAVTVFVTGDAGTQNQGTVGSGACTHEGNGFHTYAPSQAETNYDHIGFTFTGTGAIPATVQIYTSFPQTGDSYARLGAPAGASIAADLVTIDDFLDTEIAAIKTQTDKMVFTVANQLDVNVLSISGDGTAADNLETMLDGTGGQTLTLSKLRILNGGAAGCIDIDNSSGPGISILCTGGNGSGITSTGDGTGHGLYLNGGSSGGNGFTSIGGVNGDGFHCEGDGTGNGFHIVGGATSGNGIKCIGNGTASAMYVLGAGTNSVGIQVEAQGTGAGVDITGGGSDGPGIKVLGGATSGPGMSITGDGTGAGIIVTGGDSNGAGIRVVAGASNGVGISILGDGSGAGISSTGGDTSGAGLLLTGGVTAGQGLTVVGTGNGAGGSITGAGTGSGIVITKGASGTAAIDAANLPAALVGGRIQSDVGSIAASTLAASSLSSSAQQMIAGEVDEGQPFTSTTTEFESSNITEATANHYNGRIIIFLDGALAGQACSILDYAFSGGYAHFTVSTLTEAPANADTFLIV